MTKLKRLSQAALKMLKQYFRRDGDKLELVRTMERYIGELREQNSISAALVDQLKDKCRVQSQELAETLVKLTKTHEHSTELQLRLNELMREAAGLHRQIANHMTTRPDELEEATGAYDYLIDTRERLTIADNDARASWFLFLLNLLRKDCPSPAPPRHIFNLKIPPNMPRKQTSPWVLRGSKPASIELGLFDIDRIVRGTTIDDIFALGLFVFVLATSGKLFGYYTSRNTIEGDEFKTKTGAQYASLLVEYMENFDMPGCAW